MYNVDIVYMILYMKERTYYSTIKNIMMRYENINMNIMKARLLHE